MYKHFEIACILVLNMFRFSFFFNIDWHPQKKRKRMNQLITSILLLEEYCLYLQRWYMEEYFWDTQQWYLGTGKKGKQCFSKVVFYRSIGKQRTLALPSLHCRAICNKRHNWSIVACRGISRIFMTTHCQTPEECKWNR